MIEILKQPGVAWAKGSSTPAESSVAAAEKIFIIKIAKITFNQFCKNIHNNIFDDIANSQRKLLNVIIVWI